MFNRRTIFALTLLSAVGAVGVAGASTPIWKEGFSNWPQTWGSPRQKTDEIQAVFRIEKEGTNSFLRAEHDAVPAPGKKIPSAVHFGHAFRSPDVRLADACILSWKWRVLEHPKSGADAWSDVAASVYVVTRNPGLFAEGRGFKFGWLSSPGAKGTKQRGILQIEQRRDAANSSFIEESIDLCALHEQHFGPLGEEKLLYVGLVTDADNSKSVARADYDDFRLTKR